MEKESLVAKHKEKIILLSKEFEPETVRPAFKPDKPVPLVKVIILVSNCHKILYLASHHSYCLKRIILI